MQVPTNFKIAFKYNFLTFEVSEGVNPYKIKQRIPTIHNKIAKG